MNSLGIARKSFAKRLEVNMQRVDSRLEAYLGEQNVESIHDMRTAIRRLQVSFNLLPKNVRRTMRVRRYLDRCTKFFRLNTEIRDIEIIARILAIHKILESSPTMTRLMERKMILLGRARAAALSFQGFRKPNFESSKLPKSKLKRRFRKVRNKLLARIDKRQAMLMAGSASIEDLHALRKDCKKLRYTLEFVQVRGRESKIIQKLNEWQNVLGGIHDADVTIEFLRDSKETEWSEPILAKLLEERRKSAEKLSEIAEVGSMDVTKTIA